jgi:hypothetical protein
MVRHIGLERTERQPVSNDVIIDRPDAGIALGTQELNLDFATPLRFGM